MSGQADPARASAETAEQARAAAAAAAEQAGVRVGAVHAAGHLEDVSELLDRVWGHAPGSAGVLPADLLRAMEHAGCHLAAAFEGDRMVGASAGLIALDAGEVGLHSHVTGIDAGARGRGIGWALKLAQRAWCLDRGITRVRWTVDPLVRRNAVFNLVKLGARPLAYLADAYGPPRETAGAGAATDRLLLGWDLASARVVQASQGRFAEPGLEGLRRAGAVEVLRAEDGEPVTATVGGPRLLAQVPAEIEQLRVEEPALARRWAQAFRGTVGAAIRDGYQVTGCTRDGWYVLVRPRGVEELA